MGGYNGVSDPPPESSPARGMGARGEEMWVTLSPEGEGIGAETASHNGDGHPSAVRCLQLQYAGVQ